MKEVKTLKLTLNKKWFDHCHKTKKVRGLLCNRCNTLLGLIDDNPEFMENITNYLNK